jgi:NADH-quinone oxidoreductase subunit D
MTATPDLGDSIFEVTAPRGGLDDDHVITLSLGPQHPSTHGVLRLILQLQGETVTHADLEMGWLHRATEKLGEARTYVQGTVLTDRLDYVAPMTTNWA